MKMQRTIALSLALAFVGSLAAPGRAQAGSSGQGTVIELDRERVLLGDLWPEASAEHAMLDLGAAPIPGRSRLYVRRELAPRLNRLGVDAARLPERVEVRRAAQRLDQSALHALVAQTLRKALPAGLGLGELTVARELWLPPGEVTVSAAPLSPRVGRQAVRVEIATRGIAARHLSATVQLVEDASAGAIVHVARGQRVTLRVTIGEIVAALGGVAQQEARTGERVAVVADAGRKLLHGIVAPDGAVEVEP